MSSRLVMIGQNPVHIKDVIAVADARARVMVDPSLELRNRIRKSAEMLVRNAEPDIYGVSTGVGASVKVHIPAALRQQLPLNLIRFHGCGTGRVLAERETAAIVMARLASLCRGYSGVREEVLQRLCDLLNARVLPRVPEEGSVGASGDLTPLSYVAALLVGEREATQGGRLTTAAEAHHALGLAPLELRPKESLALMNGTSFMMGLACVAFDRARRLARLSATLTALISQATLGNPEHFEARIFELKPFVGQALCAEWIRADLQGSASYEPLRLQDRYSLRCAPHIIGVLVDALLQAETWLEIELNSVNDNPIVDPDSDRVLHGGNFYGGHLCFIMDGLKSAVANVVDLLDRQLLILCGHDTSGGLPENLVGVLDDSRVVHHGFKAMQISTSALAAEACKLAMPASVFSRSTELHNQDKVSMGSIAARDCLRIVELCETTAAITTLAAVQALDLRGGRHSRRAEVVRSAVRAIVEPLTQDRAQDQDIVRVVELLRHGVLAMPGLEPWEARASAHATTVG